MRTAAAPLAEVVEYLDAYLRIREVPDEAAALNGLQVENAGRIGRIVAAVDATQATIRGLRPAPSGRRGQAQPERRPVLPTLLLVHHGLFWDGNRPVTGRRFQRLRALLEQDTAVYAAHIPLDIHPEVGNNAVLGKRLGLKAPAVFGDYKGIPLGVMGQAPKAVGSRETLRQTLARELGIPARTVRVVAGGPGTIGRIGIITGSGGGMIARAQAAGCDTFITGEASAHHFHDAMELGMNLVLAGHYATETVGVQALAAHLAKRFGLPWEFHDHPTGM